MMVSVYVCVCAAVQASRNYRSVAVTVKRLEEAAISCRGPERVQLLRRWLIVLKEIENMSAASAEGKEKTLEEHLAIEEEKENPKRPSLVSYKPSCILCMHAIILVRSFYLRFLCLLFYWFLSGSLLRF